MEAYKKIQIHAAISTAVTNFELSQAERKVAELQIKQKVREINNQIDGGYHCQWSRHVGTAVVDGKPVPLANGYYISRARFKGGKLQVQATATRRWMTANIDDSFEFTK
jgi:hypothetical protein